MIWIYQDNAGDKAVEIEAEVEVNEVCNSLKIWLHLVRELGHNKEDD